jgi:DNA invertase Pin-like site-specific DNA recombinase
MTWLWGKYAVMSRYSVRYQRRKAFKPSDLSAVAFRRAPLSGDARATVNAQRNSIKRFAAANSYEIWKTFTDETKPTAGLKDRPALVRLLNELISLKIRLVIVDCLDRLTEQPVTLKHLLKYFDKIGVRVLEAGRTGDPSTPPMLKADAEAKKEVSLLKREVTQQTKGKSAGRPIYGQTPEEQAAVARMIELARMPKDSHRGRHGRVLRRASAEQIAKVMNAEGFRRKGETSWTRDAIRGVLRRERPNWGYR